MTEHGDASFLDNIPEFYEWTYVVPGLKVRCVGALPGEPKHIELAVTVRAQPKIFRLRASELNTLQPILESYWKD